MNIWRDMIHIVAQGRIVLSLRSIVLLFVAECVGTCLEQSSWCVLIYLSCAGLLSFSPRVVCLGECPNDN